MRILLLTTLLLSGCAGTNTSEATQMILAIGPLFGAMLLGISMTATRLSKKQRNRRTRLRIANMVEWQKSQKLMVDENSDNNQ